MANPTPPSDDDDYRKFSELRAKYSKFHTRTKRSRRLYDLDFENEVLSPGARARGFKAVIPRTARRAIDEAVDHVLYNPKIHMPVRPTESELVTQQQIAEKKRKAVTAWWRQVSQRFNPIGDGRKHLFLDGMIAIRQVPRMDLVPDVDDPDYRAKLKKLGRNEFLWDIELLDNTWVFLDPSDHRNPRYGYLSYSMTVEDAREKFPEGESEEGKLQHAAGYTWRGRTDYTKVNYMEMWTAPTFKDDGTWDNGRYKQWIETEVVHDDINPFPYVPIAVEDSGYGVVTRGAEIEDKFVGLLDFSRSVLIAQARQWSAMEAVAELTAFNPIVARNMTDERLKQLNVAPGEIWSLEGAKNDPTAEDMELAKFPDIPITVPQMIQLTDREVNSSMKTEMLGGSQQKGVGTATQQDSNARNAAAKLSGPLAALERLSAKMTRWMLMDIELVFDAPVTLFGIGAEDASDITLTPREINGYYDCYVELRTSDEEETELTKARFWGEMYRVLPFLSAFTAMERGGISDDPLMEMLKRSGEDVFLSDEFRQIRIATGAESFGELAQMISQMVAAKGAGGAPAGGGGTGTLPAAGGSAVAGGGAASDQGLTTDAELAAPTQAGVTAESLTARDTRQAASELRAAKFLGNGLG